MARANRMIRIRPWCVVLVMLAQACAPESSRRGKTPWRPGGCRVRDCPSGSYCDLESGYCAARGCQDGCPDGTQCNHAIDRCEGPLQSEINHTPSSYEHPDDSQYGQGLWAPPE